LCEKAFRIIIEEEFKPSRCADLIRPLMKYLKERIGKDGMTADEFLDVAMRDSEKNCTQVIGQLLKSIADESWLDS
jgi:hypothetical protein